MTSVDYATMFGELLNQIRKSSSTCPVCDRKFTDLDDIAFIRQAGECIYCDHVRGDVDQQLLSDAQEAYVDAQ